MEREIMLTGIGGQGVQLAAQVLARAATLEGRYVTFFGVYGGMMRGGNTDSTVVVADRPIEAPPIISATWSAIVMHHEYWTSVKDRIRPGGLVLLNSTVVDPEIVDAALDRTTTRIVDVPATGTAAELGNLMWASMVMTGAYIRATELVALDSAVEAMRRSLPPYRQQHADANARALQAGYELLDGPVAPTWEEVTVA